MLTRVYHCLLFCQRANVSENVHRAFTSVPVITCNAMKHIIVFVLERCITMASLRREGRKKERQSGDISELSRGAGKVTEQMFKQSFRFHERMRYTLMEHPQRNSLWLAGYGIK